MTLQRKLKSYSGSGDTKLSIEDCLDDLPEWEPYDVQCARCGKILSCEDAVPEEGDEWECFPCWERCNAKEREEVMQNRSVERDTLESTNTHSTDAGEAHPPKTRNEG